MKTLNNHPQWFNQPLRLSKDEKHNPYMVFGDFFDCYHLQDVRQILWRWLVAVISSPQSISSDPLERSSHIYFYEKMEELIEAAYVMKKRMHKHRRRKEKRKFQKNNQLSKTQAVKTEESIDSTTPMPLVEKVENEELPNKPKQLIEYANENPLYVIREVFMPDKWFGVDEVQDWLFICLSVDCTIYDDADQRSKLIVFYDQLLLLIEALFVINLQHIDDADLKKKLSSAYKPSLLNTFQIANPEQVIASFFEKFPTVYIMRELEDWYEASISYSGDWRGNVICLQQVWDIYRNILCLIKTAEQILHKTRK